MDTGQRVQINALLPPSEHTLPAYEQVSSHATYVNDGGGAPGGEGEDGGGTGAGGAEEIP